MAEALTLTKAERVGVAKYLRHKGYKLAEIGAELDRDKSTVCEYLKDPTLERARKRREAGVGKGGPCACGCGERTHATAKFVNFHALRRTPHPYRVEDRGHTTPCWVWQGCSGYGGYGRLTRDRKTYMAHRAYYMEHVGPIPDGYQVDHLCHVPACVNPEHLEAVTVAENTRRRRSNKLTMDQAREIREADGYQHDIAERYGVSKGTVSLIKAGKAWKEEAVHAV